MRLGASKPNVASTRRALGLMRSFVLFVFAFSLACNVVVGAFTGVVHAHEHELRNDVGHDHDHDRDDDHLPSVAMIETDDDSAKMDRDPGGDGRHVHEHPADVVLCLSVEQDGFHRVFADRWIRPKTSSVPSRGAGPAERPPRFV